MVLVLSHFKAFARIVANFGGQEGRLPRGKEGGPVSFPGDVGSLP